MLCLHLLAFKWDPASLLPPAKAQASFKHERHERCSDLISPVLFALKAGQKAIIS